MKLSDLKNHYHNGDTNLIYAKILLNYLENNESYVKVRMYLSYDEDNEYDDNNDNWDLEIEPYREYKEVILTEAEFIRSFKVL